MSPARFADPQRRAICMERLALVTGRSAGHVVTSIATDEWERRAFLADLYYLCNHRLFWLLRDFFDPRGQPRMPARVSRHGSYELGAIRRVRGWRRQFPDLSI